MDKVEESSSSNGIETAMTTYELTEITRSIVKAVRKHEVDEGSIARGIDACVKKKLNSYEVCEVCRGVNDDTQGGRSERFPSAGGVASIREGEVGTKACKRVPKYRCHACRRSMCSRRIGDDGSKSRSMSECIECVSKKTEFERANSLSKSVIASLNEASCQN